MLFLYRHAVELYLKAAVQPTSLNHELLPLMQDFERVAYAEHLISIPERLRQDLLIFAGLDERGDGFRYSKKKDGHAQVLPGEYWVTVRDLRRWAEDLFEFLDASVQRIFRAGSVHAEEQAARPN